jgi:hypothetical protein
MSTTTLFVELVVIGAGAAGWLLLLVLAILNPGAVPEGIVKPSTELLIAALPGVYVLGIVTDRIADALFEHLFVRGMRDRYFPVTSEY